MAFTLSLFYPFLFLSFPSRHSTLSYGAMWVCLCWAFWCCTHSLCFIDQDLLLWPVDNLKTSQNFLSALPVHLCSKFFLCHVLLNLYVGQWGQFLNIGAASFQHRISLWVCFWRSLPAPNQMHKIVTAMIIHARFTAYILICSHGLSYHRIKYVNVPVECSLWQWQPRLNTISLNEATQRAFTTDTDSSLFGTSSVGLFGCLFMPLCDSVWMKGRLRQGVYIMGVRIYLGVLLCQMVYMYVCLFLTISVRVLFSGYICAFLLCIHPNSMFMCVLVCFHQCIVSFCCCSFVAHFNHSGWMERVCGVAN